jgi:(p)ppGpp synthase/HD superfamily hydrolase
LTVTKKSSAHATPRAASADNHTLWQHAAAFAARAHRNQMRRDGRTPYVSHVVRVALTVTQVFECHDPLVLTAALLHDTIEDTTTDYDELEEKFGRQVAECVAALTKNMALPETRREDEYDQRLAEADWRARLIKLADVYDNFCDTETGPEEKEAKRRKEAYEKCLRALELAQPDSGRADTQRAIAAVESLIARYRKKPY